MDEGAAGWLLPFLHEKIARVSWVGLGLLHVRNVDTALVVIAFNLGKKYSFAFAEPADYSDGIEKAAIARKQMF